MAYGEIPTTSIGIKTDLTFSATTPLRTCKRGQRPCFVSKCQRKGGFGRKQRRDCRGV